uniref:BUD22 domain-containing protein n=1 Tax=Ascaris lumbricoides TaxID=6252 RepID=A0A0M3IJB6_ASCLU
MREDESQGGSKRRKTTTIKPKISKHGNRGRVKMRGDRKCGKSKSVKAKIHEDQSRGRSRWGRSKSRRMEEAKDQNYLNENTRRIDEVKRGKIKIAKDRKVAR